MSVTKLHKYLDGFTRHQLEMKMYHFQTKSYGAHKASDAYLVKYAANFDRFMEVAQGDVGQIRIVKVKLDFPTLTDKTVKTAINRFIKMMEGLDSDFDTPELLAIRDELIADAQQLKYLLLFK